MVDRRCAREQIPDVSIRTPQEWRTNARDRRHVPGNYLKDLPQEALRRPTGQTDPASRPAHAHQFACGLLVVGREHDAERGEHDVETRGRIRQVLGIRHREWCQPKRIILEHFSEDAAQAAQDHGAKRRIVLYA